MKKLLIYVMVMFAAVQLAAGQDLNARVQVIAPKLPSANKRILNSLETAMKDFLNGRKWAADQLQPQERIDCNFVLNVTAFDGNSTFSGELLVQSSRPVYGSSYSSPILNMNDKDFDFTYTEGQTLDYTDANFQSNLTSVMAFYAYMIIGMDYDTFSRFGGTPYFQAAQTVVVNAQTSSFKGWKAFDNNNYNRYWFAENINNQVYQPLRSFLYDYHRNGLDLMANNANAGRKNISGLLPALSQVDRQRLGAMFPLLFFTAKSDEMISLFSGADNQQKMQAYNILSQADPANGNKYQAIKTN